MYEIQDSYHLLSRSPVPQASLQQPLLPDLDLLPEIVPDIQAHKCLCKYVAFFTKWEPTIHIVSIFLFFIAVSVKI